jgi:pSer/pThr/pTyr-binding forkhead associated (FHA) protein
MPSYVVGRSEDCSIVIRSKFLSRHHALISNDSRGWSIADLNSTNGLQVNGRQVKMWRLKDGDVVDIGECQLRFTSQEYELPDLGTETEVLNLDA